MTTHPDRPTFPPPVSKSAPDAQHDPGPRAEQVLPPTPERADLSNDLEPVPDFDLELADADGDRIAFRHIDRGDPANSPVEVWLGGGGAQPAGWSLEAALTLNDLRRIVRWSLGVLGFNTGDVIPTAALGRPNTEQLQAELRDATGPHAAHVITRRDCGFRAGEYGRCDLPVGHDGFHREHRDGQLWAEWRGGDAPSLNPDCAAGKHAACSGDAWDDARDQRTDCACPCHCQEADRG